MRRLDLPSVASPVPYPRVCENTAERFPAMRACQFDGYADDRTVIHDANDRFALDVQLINFEEARSVSRYVIGLGKAHPILVREDGCVAEYFFELANITRQHGATKLFL